MALADIREQIKTIISATEGVGRVHDYDRWAADWKKMLELFKHTDAEGNEKINGWVFTRTKTPERWLTNIKYLRVYEWLIRGVYGLQDDQATELIYQNIIENICGSFRTNNTLNGTCETIAPEFGSFNGLAGVQVQLVEVRMFAGVLCHYCELGLGVQVAEVRS